MNTRRWTAALALLLLAAVAGPILFHRLGAASLAGDEAIYGTVAREAALQGSWLPLRFERHVFLEKPPLAIWLMAIAFRLCGVSEWSARLPGALLGAAIVLLVFAAGRACFGLRVGLIAALLLLTAHRFLFEHGLRAAVLESPLVLLFSAALLLYLRWRGGAAGLPTVPLRPFQLAVIGLLLGADLLVKSPVPVLALATMAAWELLLAPPGSRLRNLRAPAWIALIAAAVYAPWPLLLLRATGGGYLTFLRGDLLDRATGHLVASHARPATVYLDALWTDFGFSLVLLAAVPLLLLRPIRPIRPIRLHCGRSADCGRACFLGLWVLAVCGFFVLPASRNEWYVDPAYPALALLLALAAVRLYDGVSGRSGAVGLRRAAGLQRAARLALLVVCGAWLAQGLRGSWLQCCRAEERSDAHRIALFLDGLGRPRVCLEQALQLREWSFYYLLPHVTRTIPPGQPDACDYVIAGSPERYLGTSLLPARTRHIRRLAILESELALVALHRDLPPALRSFHEGSPSASWSYVAYAGDAMLADMPVRSRCWSAEERLHDTAPAAELGRFPARGLMVWQRYRYPQDEQPQPDAAPLGFGDGWLQGGEGTLLVASGAGEGRLSLIFDTWHQAGKDQAMTITTRTGRTLRFELPGWRVVRVEVPVGRDEVRPWPRRTVGWVPLEIVAAAWQPSAAEPPSFDTRHLGCRVLAVLHDGRLLATAGWVDRALIRTALPCPALAAGDRRRAPAALTAGRGRRRP